MKTIKKGILVLFVFSTMLQQNWSSKQHVQAIGQTSNLSSDILNLLSNEPALKGSLAGISIRDDQSGKIIFEYQGNTRLAPASNMKLLTAAAALNVLGKDYRFKTEIFTDGMLKKGKLHGNLYIKGKGDTTLHTSDFDELAKILRNKGIKQVKGNLIADSSWYDSTPLSIDLAWSDEETYYGAKISALTASPNNDYDAGTVIVEISPAKTAGQPGNIEIKPKTDEVKLINKTRTVHKNEKKELSFTRLHGSKTIEVTGTIPVDESMEKEWISVWNPSTYAADLFSKSMEKNHIQWKGAIQEGETPELPSLLASHSSVPLSELLIPFMKLSNNTIAETLLKEMGKVEKGEGSFEKGLEVMKEELPSFGLHPKNMLLRDASGISPIDLLTPNDLTMLLFTVQKKPWFSVYINSLPVSGNKDRMVGGSLRNRLQSENTNGKVFAKTGSLSAVSTLTGYVQTKSGKRMIFSILLNHLIDEEKGKAIQDKIVEILAEQY
ncbi:D-alanyl-D-alanine carboxypeptidase/D-alanyl-D-alanine endopeptidase [Niallia sp. 03133]|uniref:D-alanyl-D-alanine carboxypeptidase/D-alanyl-D-alanine endopeptidase n=1 Tax=Niallia sp. 03133 TaxID=3458060 RepID=UPI004043DDE5